MRLLLLFLALTQTAAASDSLMGRLFKRSGTECGNQLIGVKKVTTEKLLRTKEPGLRIEIGAALSPLCADCVQVDQSRDQFELARRSLKERLGRNPSHEEIYEAFPTWEISQERGSRAQPWAVTKGGIQADAAALPFKAGSVALLVSKNFPWFGATSPETVALILTEYRRVLSPKGQAILLVDYVSPNVLPTTAGRPNMTLDTLFYVHRRLGHALDFSVQYVRERNWKYGGIILRPVP